LGEGLNLLCTIVGTRIEMAGALKVWRSRAPPNCKVFLWLGASNRWWTTDEQAWPPAPAACPGGRVLGPPSGGCILAREVWAICLHWWGKLHWMPQPDTGFVRWLQEKWGGLGADRDFLDRCDTHLLVPMAPSEWCGLWG
jgi:hypothetical protein